MSEETISQHDFVDWKNHVVTKQIFRDLNLLREEITEQLMDSNLIGFDYNLAAVNRLIGERNAYDRLLQIHFVEDDQEVSLDD